MSERPLRVVGVGDGRLGAHRLHQVELVRVGHPTHFFQEVVRVGAFRGQGRLERAVRSGLDREGARVHAADAGNVVFDKEIVQGGPPLRVVRGPAFLPHHAAAGPQVVRFRIVGMDAVVSNHGVREHEELALVGRIGEALLVARHLGGENEFPEDGLLGPKRPAPDNRPVLKDQGRGAV